MAEAERQALIESLPLAFVEIDRAGRIRAWNRPYVEITGADPATVAGSLLLDVASRTPEAEALLREATREVFELGRAFTGEAVGLGTGGRRVVLRSHFSPVRDAAGAVVGARILTEDVTAFRALEAQLAESEQSYRDLFENAPVAYLEFSSPETGQRITRWNRRAAALIDRTEEELRAGVNGADVIASDRAPEIVSSVVRATYQDRAQSVLDVPLRAKDGRITWARTVTIPLLDAAGTVVGTRAISEDVTPLHEAEAALARSEAELRTLYDNAPLAYSVLDLDARLVRWNGRVEELFGVEAAKLRPGIDVRELLRPTPEAEAAIADTFRRILTAGEEQFTVEVPFTRLDGSPRWVRSHTRPARAANGEVVGIASLTEDITELHAVREALAYSERELADLYQNAPLAYYVIDLSGRLVRWNARVAKFFAVAPEFLREGLFVGDLVRAAAESEARIRETLERTGQRGEGYSIETPFLRHDGEQRVARSHTSPVREARGAIVGIGVQCEDLTDMRRAEAALAASEAELRNLYENAPLVFYSLDRELRLALWNERMASFWHVEPHVLHAGMPIGDLARPTPESEGALTAVADQVIARGMPATIEAPLVLRDGAQRVIRAHLEPLRGASGEIVGVSSINEDVTELRRAEESARESDAQVRALFAGAADGMVAFDERGVVARINSAAERMVGTPESEIVGGSFERFVLPEFAPSLRAAMQMLLTTRDVRPQFSPPGMRVRRADGRTFESESTLSLTFAGGKPLFLIIFRDIEERRALERERESLLAQNEQLQAEIKATHDFESIVGQSRALASTLEQVARVAPTLSTVLILGETGTGKELIARAIHARSPRSAKPLVKVNCAALPAGLIESELFGHERGAFTGATERRVGRFELADGGTLFLDEVGELPLETQAKLLRALQEREFERVGSAQTRKTDVRLIAATNRDLKALADEGKFRADLYYRLHVFPVSLPPLRERGDDILLLARFFLERFAAKLGRAIARIEPDTAARLLAYAWPGNVRELENVIERAVILETSDALRIAPAMLPAATPEPARTGAAPAPPSALARAAASAPAKAASAPPTSPLTLEETQRRAIVAALEAASWRVAGPRGAAAALGVSESTLRSQMQRFGIARPR